MASWQECRIERSRELSLRLREIKDGDVGEIVRLARFIAVDSELDYAKMNAFRFPLLLLGRELWRRAGTVGGDKVGSDEWHDFNSEIAMGIALGEGVGQNLPLAYEMLLDGFAKVEPPGSFPHHFIEIGATADVVRDRLPDAKLAQLQDEEECWLEDDGIPGENPAIPFGWWMDKRPVERKTVELALNDHDEVNAVLKNVGGPESFLDWSSLRREFAFYGSDGEFHYFTPVWVEAIAKDDVGKVMAIVDSPAFGHKGLMSLFWCGATRSLSAVNDIKLAILQARMRAAQMSNVEALKLYLYVGGYVSRKTRKAKWGMGAIDALSCRLQVELPGLRGFSPSSIKRMRSLFEEWNKVLEFRPLAMGENGDGALVSIRPLAMGELTNDDVAAFLSVGFTHHSLIVEKVKPVDERWYYIRRTAKESWTVDELRSHLRSDDYRHGKPRSPGGADFAVGVLLYLQPHLSASPLSVLVELRPAESFGII